MSKAALDLFGNLLITKVRDEAVSDWISIANGTMKGDRAKQLRKVLDRFSEDQRNAVLSLIPEVVDTVLHHLLWMFEQQDELTIGVVVDGTAIHSLKDVSDGLAGELYSDEGWIARFSTEA